MTSAAAGILRCVLASEKAGNSLDRDALAGATAALQAIRDGAPDGAGAALEAQRVAQRLAAGPAGTLARIKRLVWDAADRDLPGHLPHEARSIGKCAASPDGIEGVNAFCRAPPARLLDPKPAYQIQGPDSRSPAARHGGPPDDRRRARRAA